MQNLNFRKELQTNKKCDWKRTEQEKILKYWGWIYKALTKWRNKSILISLGSKTKKNVF